MGDRADSTALVAERPSLISRVFARLWSASSRARGARAGHPSHAESTAAATGPAEEVPPLEPLTIRQWLWGPGFHTPGNKEYVLNLVKPFAANPAMSILDVAAGLGGAARAMAEAFGTYVTGLERDPELARLGMEMSVAHGQQRHAPVTVMDPESFELRTGAFDCILGRAATYMVTDKERFMRVLILGLKQRGQLLLTDFVVEPALAQRTELATWARLQPHPPSLWSVRQYTDCLNSLGFDTRIAEDITASVKMQIILGWDNLLQTVNLRSLPRPHRFAVVDEVERWMRTTAAFDSGALKVYRFYALAGPSRPPLSSIKKKAS
ncbi:MAG TPA: methyltransferase domain-containing protein [Stellaceae bacterium]|nr:methyltransferase domain-containing protein [Stellaceae bacterium]